MPDPTDPNRGGTTPPPPESGETRESSQAPVLDPETETVVPETDEESDENEEDEGKA